MAEQKRKPKKPTPKPDKRPRDVNQLAKWVVQQGTGEQPKAQKT